MKGYFKIKNKASDERAKLYIYDQIGKDWWTDEGVSDKDVIGWLVDAGGKPLDVHINSVGGNVYEGIAICNALRNYENNVTIYIDGIAASIASVIACGSDDVRINSGASMMIHGVSGGFFAYGSAENIKDESDRYIAAMENCKESIIDIYETKTGMSRNDLSDMMGTDTYLSANEAVAKGFCNEVLNKKPDKTQENSLKEQMRTYPNQQMQAVINRLFSAPNSEPVNKPKAVSNSIIDKGVVPMDPKELEAKLKAEAEAASAKAIAEFKEAENKRQTSIKAIFNGKHESLMNTCLLDQECTPENAKDKLLDRVLNAPPENNSAVSIGAVPKGQFKDEIDNKIDGIKAFWDGNREGKHDGANNMNGATMHTAIAVVAKKHGKDTTGYGGEQLYNLVSSDMQISTDFAVLLSDNLNKYVLKGYQLAPTTYQHFVRFGNFNDFRSKEAHMLGTIGSLPKKKKENAEYEIIKLPDSEAQSFAPEERGGLIVLSRVTLINNELGNLEGQAQDAGLAGGLTLDELFYDYLESNPKLKDGKALFSDDHGNILPSGDPSEETLILMQSLFDAQTAPNSPKSFLNITADRVLADRKRLAIIRELITKETGKEAKETIDFFSREMLIFAQRMANLGTYFFANPEIAPVIEAAFLNGLRVPTLATKEHFESGAMIWRLMLDCAVGAVNYRGGIYQPPASGGAGRSAKADK